MLFYDGNVLAVVLVNIDENLDEDVGLVVDCLLFCLFISFGEIAMDQYNGINGDLVPWDYHNQSQYY